MGPGRIAAVADTGPLIHLAEIGCLPLLSIFEVLHIPEGVWREADRPATIREELKFAKRHTLQIEEVESFTADHGLEKLQAGERESLLLCSQLGVPVLLTDDLAVRRAAKSLGLTPVGSLGIIAKAHRIGRITTEAAERHLRELYSVSSLFVTQTIVDLGNRALAEHGWRVGASPASRLPRSRKSPDAPPGRYRPQPRSPERPSLGRGKSLPRSERRPLGTEQPLLRRREGPSHPARGSIRSRVETRPVSHKPGPFTTPPRGWDGFSRDS